MTRRKMIEIGKALFERLMKSETPLPLSKVQQEMGTHFNTLKHHLKYIQLVQNMPKISVTKIGKQIVVETEKTNEDLQFLKEIIGEDIPNHTYLLLDLYRAKATTIEKAVPLSAFSNDFKTLDIQAKQQRVIITTDSRVYLTPLGLGIAKGAERYITLMPIKRKLPQSMSFDISIPRFNEEELKSALIHTTMKSIQGVNIPSVREKAKARFEKGKLIIEIPLERMHTLEDATFMKEEE